MKNKGLWFALLLPLLGLNYSCNSQESSEPKFGLIPTPDSILRTIPFASYNDPEKFFRALPKSFELTDSMPPAMNQGQQFSCVAFSTTYYLLSYFENPNRKQKYLLNGKLDYSRLYSPSYTYNSILAARNPNGTSCGVSVTFPEALEFLKRQGAVTLAVMPYDTLDAKACLKPTATGAADPTKLRRILSFNRMAAYKAQFTLAEERKPFMIGMFVPETFYQDGLKAHKDGLKAPKEKKHFVWNYSNVPRKTFHAMICMGYDANIGGGSYRIMNSWGADWGNEGSFYLKYKDLAGITSNELYVAYKGTSNLIPIGKLLAMKAQPTGQKFLESNRLAKKVTDSLLGKINHNKSNKDKSKARLDVLKLGYYQGHDRFLMGLSYVDEQSHYAVFELYRQGEKESFQRLVLQEGENVSFTDGKREIIIGLNKIQISGTPSETTVSYFLIKQRIQSSGMHNSTKSLYD